MPTYEYACTKCGDHLEVYQTFSETPLTRHADCGGQLKKVFAPVGIVLKGSGFYKSDSRAASRAKSKASETKASDSSSDSKSDTKTESKSDSKSETTKSDSSSTSTKTSTKPAKKSA